MRVYLDHQATTPLLAEVKEAMEPFLGAAFGNPSSLHSEGIRARDSIGRSREQFAQFLGARTPEEIIFTANGTEAVNLAIKGTAWANVKRGRHILLSAIEHPAVSESAAWLARMGFESSMIPVDPEGRISVAELETRLRPDTILLCLHQSNHDIGTVQNVAAISRITGERGIPLFVDATASAGWMECNVAELGADLLAVAPHRFYGPKGVGVLYRNRRARLESLIHGGEQEDKFRAGMENVPAIVGAGVASEFAARELKARAQVVTRLQAHTLKLVRERIENVRLTGPEPGPERHPAHLSLAVEFAEGEALGLMLDVRGVAVATGSACVSKDKRVPPVLAAIGLPEAFARGNVILSFGQDNTDAEVEFFVETFAKAVEALREMSWEQK